jgi:4-amino-4-deoxy-L-arabinose transferase-like glycosyltransferase
MDQVVHTDGVWYAVMGVNFARGLGLTDWFGRPVTFWSPLYPVALGLAWLVFPSAEVAGRLVSLISGLLCVPLIYLLARRVYDETTAWVGAFLVALVPQLALQSIWMLTEALYTLLIVAAFLSAIASFQRARWATVAGGLLGLATLTRPEALVYLLVLTAAYFGAWLVRRQAGYAVRLVAMLLAFGLAVAPYVLWLHSVTGHWALTAKTDVNFAVDYIGWETVERQHFTLTPDGTSIGGFQATRFDFLAYAVQHPLQVVSHWRQTFLEFSSELFNVGKPWFLPLAVLGLLGEVWNSRRGERWFLVAALAPLVGLSLLHADGRFVTPLLPFLCLWAARGLIVLHGWLVVAVPGLESFLTGVGSGRFALAVSALLVLWMAPLYLADRTANFDPYNEPLEIKHAGQWIRDTYGPGQIIVSRRLQVAFYAEGKLLELPLGDVGAVIKYSRANGARLLVVDSRTVPGQRPDLGPLLSDGWPGLRLVYDRTEGSRYRVRIFELP